jgi:hypothetical protein
VNAWRGRILYTGACNVRDVRGRAKFARCPLVKCRFAKKNTKRKTRPRDLNDGRTVKMQSSREQSEDSYYRRTMDFRRTNVVILVGVVVLILCLVLC